MVANGADSRRCLCCVRMWRSFQLLFQMAHPAGNLSAIRLELRFARTAGAMPPPSCDISTPRPASRGSMY